MSLLNEILTRLEHVRTVAANPERRAEIRKIPKYELHVHLGGSIRRETAIQLAEKNGVSLPSSKKSFAETPTPLQHFAGDQLWELFHNTYAWHWSCVQTCDDLKRIVIEFLEDSHEQGVVYSEIIVAGSFVMNRFPFTEWTHAIQEGIEEAEHSLGIRSGYLLDISRRSGPEVATNNVRKIIEHRPAHLVGISMGGDEVKYPCRDYTEAFALARENNIPSTVHVSEFNPGETTTEAIDSLQPDRLGHALNTIKSPAAYQRLKNSRIPVESCPLCNFVGGMGDINNLSDHPIRRYFLDGIPLSINTDDPRIFGFDLLDNYICLMKEAGFTVDDFVKINEQAKAGVFKKEPCL